MSWEAAGVIAPFVMQFLWDRVQSRRLHNHLDYRVQTNVALLDAGRAAPFGSRLGVTYDGETLVDPGLIDVIIHNTGNQPIVASDYTKPITIRFEPCEFVSATVVAQRGDVTTGNEWLWNSVTHTLTGTPKLIKPDEWFALRFIIDGAVSDPDVDCRYPKQTRGVQDTEGNYARRLQRRIVIGMAGFMLASLAVMACLLYKAFGHSINDWLQWTVMAAGMWFGSDLFSEVGIAIYRSRKNRWRYQWTRTHIYTPSR